MNLIRAPELQRLLSIELNHDRHFRHRQDVPARLANIRFGRRRLDYWDCSVLGPG